MNHLERTMHVLTQVFATFRRVVVLVSGGKDSLTLLHILKPWRDLVTVLHMIEPDGFPDVTSNVIAQMNAWGFLRSMQIEPQRSFKQYVEEFGWPVAIVPTDLDGATTRPLSPYFTGDVKLASWWHCTLYRRLIPLGWALASLQAEMVLTGTKGSDASLYRTQGEQWSGLYEGWQRVDPLHGWSDAHVYDYVDTHTIHLPSHYAVKRHSDGWEWPDCLSCTWQPEHWVMLRDHYPEEYEKRWPVVAPVFEALKAQMTALGTRFEVLEGESRG